MCERGLDNIEGYYILGLFWYTVSFYSRSVSFIFARIICMNYKEKLKVVRVKFTLQFILSYREVRWNFGCWRQKLSSFNLRENVYQYQMSYIKLVYVMERNILFTFLPKDKLKLGRWKCSEEHLFCLHFSGEKRKRVS